MHNKGKLLNSHSKLSMAEGVNSLKRKKRDSHIPNLSCCILVYLRVKSFPSSTEYFEFGWASHQSYIRSEVIRNFMKYL